MPLRRVIAYLLPILIFPLIDNDIFWVTIVTVICRFESNTPDALFAWELNVHPRLVAIAKPLVPAFLSWKNDVLPDLSTSLMTVLRSDSRVTEFTATMWVE